ncbi:hypothetical protein BDW74DRAFT_170968 [Aspergillus multicolor]|uniref:uncharacterized protein n=1 Tax=Aspergillus multicolor TaxID=41759 RepID=UPI003CCCD136
MSVPPSSAASARSPNLNVPATQGTAPVVKFRCLFTYDLRRKAKRWQDGFLRYHTFNKRVMVYDNTGYFVGDLHWRAPEGIQDGDELELDKGVLIQVCEPLEKTETDISPLYQNKSQPSPSHPNNAPPSSVRSTPRPLVSQHAPRSLNDLLGIRKTPAPQVRPPYEQRNAQRQVSTHQPHERPAKRQRTFPERISRPAEDVVDLSDSPPRRQGPTAQTRPDPPSNQQAPTPLSNQPLTPRSSTAAQPPRSPVSRPTPQSGPQDPKPVNTGPEPSVNTLRLAASKPRRKLMYQEPTVPVQRPLPRKQLSRSISQHQPTIKHRSSSPVIILDDDDDVPNPQPVMSNQATRVKADPDPLPTTNIQIDVSKTDPATPLIKPPSSDDSLQRPPLSNYSLPQSSRAPPPANQQPTNQQVHPARTALKPRSPGLRKSYSDPTTINRLPIRPLTTPSPLNPAAEQNDEHEQGPWTSEALDLFDFWPPGRPKPP